MRLLPTLLLTPLTLVMACDGGGDLGAPPVAVLKAPAFCDLGAVITLDATESTDPNGDIVSFRFVIADGTQSKEVVAVTANHTCLVEGLIEAMLEVADAKGNSAQARTVIAVRPP